MLLGQVRSLCFFCSALFLFFGGGLLAAQSPQIPVVDGGLGHFSRPLAAVWQPPEA